MATTAPSLVLRETDSSNQELVLDWVVIFMLEILLKAHTHLKLRQEQVMILLVLYSGAGEGRVGNREQIVQISNSYLLYR